MWFRRILTRYKEVWSNPLFCVSVAPAILIFATSVVASFYAISYATAQASNSVTDIILSNTPVFDVDVLMVVGTLALTLFLMLLVLQHPLRIPFALYTLTLFFFIRSGFTIVTHIASYPLPEATVPEISNSVGRFFFGFGGDLFFSAHTAVPFLMALVFWPYPVLRYLLLTTSVFFGSIVLLGHLHYTIDVLSAFFIAYGIYHLALWLFPRERELFLSSK